MSILQGFILGIIQGLGEFLPVSSSGHMLLYRIFAGIQTDSPAMKMLDILLHVGTLIPVAVVFRKEWLDMILHPVKNKTLGLLFVASLPTLAIYLLAKKGLVVNGYEGFAVFDNGWFLGVSFLISAVFLLLCDRISVSRSHKKSGKVSWLNAVVMGIFQGIGMLPGVSRSGSTILGGVSTGLSKQAAARFSFMMSAPAILASLLMEGKDAIEEGYAGSIELVPCLVGIVTAAVVGWLAIRFMLKIISRVPLAWFALYLALIGVVFLALQFSGSAGVPAFSVPAAVPVG